MDCLWCCDPTEGGAKLCPTCDAVNRHPLFHCQAGLGHLPTLGPSCAECEHDEREIARRRERNAPIIAQLEAIRARHISELGKPWPGCEFGKGHVGMMLDRAIADLSLKRAK